MTSEAIRGLVERLRRRAKFDTAVNPYKLMEEAADALSSLQSELDKAEADANGEHIINRELNRMNVDLRSKVEVLERERDALKVRLRAQEAAITPLARLVSDENGLKWESRALAAEAKVERRDQALAAIFEAHDSYRETMGPDAPTDWLDEAIDAARTLAEVKP